MHPVSEVYVSKRAALAITTLTAFLTPFISSAVNLALPAIGHEFSAGAVTLSWIATSFLMASAILLVPLGRAADIYGRKRFFSLGLSLYTLASLLSAFSGSEAMLIAFRVLQGFGSAMIFGTGVAILISVFPPGERGKALGINVTATYIGLSLGPFLGGILTQHFGWRSLFLVNVAFGLVVLALVSWKLKGEWIEAHGEKLDLAGSSLYSLSMASLMVGFSWLPSAWGVALALAGIAGLTLFYRHEMVAESPVLNVKLFRHNTVFVYSNLAALINYSATFAVGFFLSLYLQYVRGLGPRDAGLILVAQPVTMALFSSYAGRLSDRIEPRTVASLGMALTAAALFPLAFVGADTPLSFITVLLVVLGLGFALFSSPNTNAVMSSVEKRFYGVASGTLATMRLTGQMFSMAVAMMLLSFFIGKASVTPENQTLFLKSFKTAFAIFSLLCFGGVFASHARGNVRPAAASSPAAPTA